MDRDNLGICILLGFLGLLLISSLVLLISSLVLLTWATADVWQNPVRYDGRSGERADIKLWEQIAITVLCIVAWAAIGVIVGLLIDK